MVTSYNRSYSASSVFGVEFAGTNLESIHNQVHALNEFVQKLLEEADKRYMELYQCHERDTQQWRQQLQTME